MIGKAARLIRKDDGFTLIEVMIALAVLTIGILGVMGMQVHSIAENAKAMSRTRALTMGQDMIERNIETPFASLAVGTTPFTNGPYTITRVIAGSPLPNALWVTVTTTWTEGGVQKSIPITLLKSTNMEKSYDPSNEVGGEE